MDFSPSLFSTKVSAGRRTYFFDVKSAKNAKPFLKITQSEINGEEKKRNSLNVFESEVPEFQKAIDEVVSYMSHSNK